MYQAYLFFQDVMAYIIQQHDKVSLLDAVRYVLSTSNYSKLRLISVRESFRSLITEVDLELSRREPE